MVQIHVKQNDEHQLLYDCLCTSTIDAIARDIIKIHNLQLTIHYLVLQLENLCLYCPSLNPEPTDDDGKSNDVGTNKAWHSNATPTLQRALSEAKAYISKDQVLHRRPLSLLVLKDHIENIEREASASMISASHNWKQHPLPELKLLDEDTAELWWAGKKLMRDKRLSDYISNNEKTKIIVKLLPSDMCLPNCFICEIYAGRVSHTQLYSVSISE